MIFRLLVAIIDKSNNLNMSYFRDKVRTAYAFTLFDPSSNVYLLYHNSDRTGKYMKLCQQFGSPFSPCTIGFNGEIYMATYTVNGMMHTVQVSFAEPHKTGLEFVQYPADTVNWTLCSYYDGVATVFAQNRCIGTHWYRIMSPHSGSAKIT